MSIKLQDFILNSRANKLRPEDSKVVEIILKEIDNKIAESKWRKEFYNVHGYEKRTMLFEGLELHFERRVYVLKDSFIAQNQLKIKNERKAVDRKLKISSTQFSFVCLMLNYV